MRAIISNLYNFDKEFNLKTLKSIPLLSIKKTLMNLKIKSILTTMFWILTGYQKYYWLSKILNKKSNHLNIFKTHSVRHKKFTNENVNAGFIYIIRDPRMWIISFKNFTGKSLDKIINELYEKNIINTNVYELFSTWELNVLSWLNYKTVPRLIIRYEDLKLNTGSSY